LDKNGDRVFLYDNKNVLIDSVSWGDDETAFFPSVIGVDKGHSISRITAGVDTDTAADWMDTYSGSTPPGPNPGTNPHDSEGNLLTPDGVITELIADYSGSSTSAEGYSKEEIAQKLYLESLVILDENFTASSSDEQIDLANEINSGNSSLSNDTGAVSASGDDDQANVKEEISSSTAEDLNLPDENETVAIESQEGDKDSFSPVETDETGQTNEPAGSDQTGKTTSQETPAILPEEPIVPALEDKTPRR